MASTLSEAVDPWCLRDGESAGLLREHPWRRFAVLGDSVAEGLCEPADGYPGRTVGRPDRRRTPTPSGRIWRTSIWACGGCGRTRCAPPSSPRPWRSAPTWRWWSAAATTPSALGYDADAVDAELTAMIEVLRSAAGGGGRDHRRHVRRVAQPPPCRSSRTAPAWASGATAPSAHTGALRGAARHPARTAHRPPCSPPIRRMYSSDGRHGSARSDAIAAAETVRRLGTHLVPHL